MMQLVVGDCLKTLAIVVTLHLHGFGVRVYVGALQISSMSYQDISSFPLVCFKEQTKLFS